MAAMACVLSIIAMISGASVECPPGDDVLIADPDDCTKFYECCNGIPIPMSCPENMCFNSDLSVCDYCGGGLTECPPATGGYKTSGNRTEDPKLMWEKIKLGVFLGFFEEMTVEAGVIWEFVPTTAYKCDGAPTPLVCWECNRYRL